MNYYTNKTSFMLQISNINFSYGKGVNVLENFSLDISESGVYGLLGKNGTGKSTLLYLIMGLLRPQAGGITFNGTDTRLRRPEVLQDMFIVPEEYDLPAIKLSKYVSSLKPFYPNFSEDLLKECLEAFDMPYDVNLGSLSMGQKKEVYMCVALATNTRLLLMDEPTNGLDIPSKSHFRKVVSMGMSHQGNQGEEIRIPFTVTVPVEEPPVVEPPVVEPPVGEVVELKIPVLANGTVTAAKANYVIGETVKLTVTPNSGYAQKLFINGEPLLLDWKSNTYSFVATEESYEITGSFEKSLNAVASDSGRWDTANQAHGLLTANYPNNNDSWYMDIQGNYSSIAINAKNYLPVEQSYEGIANGGGFRVVLRMTLDNGKIYAFSIWIDTSMRYAYNHFGAGGSVTGWGGAWCAIADKNPGAAIALNGTGAEFKLERIDGNHMQITLNGTVLETYTIEGVTETNKVVSVGISHYGNKDNVVEIPFEVK
jgi:ABC-type Mn2+/Zn2+ transport system ATPase subunit